jgi:hypothetical protein
MNNKIESSVTVNESKIGVVAYHLWERAGRPAGQDMQFWLDAEAQLRATAKPAPTAILARTSPAESVAATTQKSPPVQYVSRQTEPAKPQQKFRKN